MNGSHGTVTAVIPTWNRADLLTNVLKSLKAQTYPLSSIVVVDNGSEDDSTAVARAYGARVIRTPINRGFAHAVNLGWRSEGSDWVAVLNNDVVLQPDWLSTIVGEAARVRAGFASGKLLAASDPARIDGTYDLVCRAGTAWRAGHGRADGALWSKPSDVRFVSFTAVLLSRAAISAVGELDERFESYYEDVDWCIRSARLGVGGVYVPMAVATHAGSATLGAWRDATVRLQSRNQMLLHAKHFRGSGAWPATVGQLLWAGMACRHAAATAALRGKIDGIRAYRGWCSEPSSWPAIQTAVEASETLIRQLQEQTGWDPYWKWYFQLTGK